MPKKRETDLYDEEEARRRFEAAIRGARKAVQEPAKPGTPPAKPGPKGDLGKATKPSS